MSKILLQTTIPAHPDDWDISRFSLLADELRAAGHEVIARNRDDRGDDDPVLSHVDELGYDQLWLMAVDVGDGLTAADADAIVRFRENGGGVLTARDHQDLGCCLISLGSLGVVNEFHDKNVDPASMCDDQDTPTISWPNYHSGANGDYQPVLDRGAGARVAAHRSDRQRSDRMVPVAPARGRGVGERPVRHRARAGPQHSVPAATSTSPSCWTESFAPDGRPMGRAIAESTFHHFADYNWDLDRGAPSFVTETPGTQIKADPSRLAIFKDYVRNVATWLQPVTSTPKDRYGQRVPAHG